MKCFCVHHDEKSENKICKTNSFRGILKCNFFGAETGSVVFRQ